MKTLSHFFSEIKNAWKIHLQSNVFKLYLIFTILFFAITVHFCTTWISILECRNGLCFTDPIVNIFTPKKLSVQIFCIVHSAMFLSIFFNLPTPKDLLKAFQAYSILLILRTFFIYAIPLEPPVGMIYLNDPLTGVFLNNINVVTKDLFFSGHISAMCVFIYFSQNKLWKKWLIFVTPILAVMLLWQHVHYTIDIIAAPFFALLCCKFIDILNQRISFGIVKVQYQV